MAMPIGPLTDRFGRNRLDDELGMVRLCARCQEEWPLDEEFWYFAKREAGMTAVARGRTYVRGRTLSATYCKACCHELNRLAWERRRAVDIDAYRERDRIAARARRAKSA